MRIAVTGGMGFIGHEVVEELLAQNHEVILVDFWQELTKKYETAKLPIMQDMYRIMPRCKVVASPWELFTDDVLWKDLDLVVHAGAVVDTMDLGSFDLFQKNVEFTQRLAEKCFEYGTDIIFFSSAAVYGANGHPNNPYGLTKAMGEKIVSQAKGIYAVSIRLFNVFGKNEHHKGAMASVPWKIANACNRRSWFELHSEDAMRDFVPSSTVVKVVCDLANDMSRSGRGYSVYDVGTGSPMTYGSLADEITRVTKRPRDEVIKVVARPAQLEGRYQLYTCAGKNGVENLGGKIGPMRGIEEAYGVD